MPDVDGFALAGEIKRVPDAGRRGRADADVGATARAICSAATTTWRRGVPDQAGAAGRAADRHQPGAPRAPRAFGDAGRRRARGRRPAPPAGRPWVQPRSTAAQILVVEDNPIESEAGRGHPGEGQVRGRRRRVGSGGAGDLPRTRPHLRPDRADGRADAGHGRASRRRARSAKSRRDSAGSPMHRRSSRYRARHAGRPRALPRRRHGRLPRQADPSGRTAGAPQALPARAGSSRQSS